MPARPSISVIIPAYRAEATLPQVLAALRTQLTSDVEVIVVDSSGLTEAAALAKAHPWLTVLPRAERTLPGRARNLGAAAAAGSKLVFLDADAVPSAGWLQALCGAATDGRIAVAGSVVNGTPGDPVGTSSYLLEFSEFIPARRGHPRHAASCNMLVERAAFEAAGGFAEDLWPGEDTILTLPWAVDGRLRFAEKATVSHLNRTGVTEFIRHQYRLGRSFAAVCDKVDFPHGGFSRWPLLPAAPWLRLAALVLRLRGNLTLLLLSPIVGLGLAAWTAGLVAGRTEAARLVRSSVAR